MRRFPGLCLCASILTTPVRSQTTGDEPAPVSRTVSGRVVDALHGTPVARALIHLNARAVLTDAQGRFTFPQFTDAQAFASVTKPGYTPSDDGADGPAMLKVADLDASPRTQTLPRRGDPGNGSHAGRQGLAGGKDSALPRVFLDGRTGRHHRALAGLHR